MSKFVSYTLFLLYFVSNVGAENKELHIRHYSVNEGLSQSSVYSILQDKIGFLWIGTGDGLNKFDGYKFTTFKHQNDNESSLDNNTIRGLLEDSLGKIWIGTELGLNVYDPLTDKISRIFIKNLKGNVLNAINPLGFSGNNIWIWRRGDGIMTYNLKDKKLKLISAKDKIITESRSAYEGKFVWYMRSGNILCKLNFTDASITEFPLISLPKDNFTFAIHKNLAGNIVLCTSNGLFEFNIKKKALKEITYCLHTKIIHDIIQDSKGNNVVAIENEGLYIFNPSWKFLETHKNEDWNLVRNGFSFNSIIGFFKDKSGNIWFGTDGDGLFKLGSNEIKFNHVSTKTFNPFTLKTNFVKCFDIDDNGTLWVGSYNYGFSEINLHKDAVKTYLPSDKKESSPQNNTINSIITDENGLWVGTRAGLYFFDVRSHQFKKIKQEGLSVDHNIFYLYKKKNNEIIVSSQGRIFKLIKGEVPHLEVITTTYKVISIIENENDLILGYAKNGFNILRNGKIIIPELLKNLTFQRTSFNGFHIDNKNCIWAATDIGLVKLSSKYDLLNLYDVKNGLPDNFIYGILQDNQENLWLSSNKGLSVFNPRNESFRNFTLDDGIQSYEFNTGAYYKSKDGEMFFGGVNGFNYFNPDSLTYNNNVPKLALTDFKVFDQPIKLDTAIEQKKQIILNYDENTISFEFAGLEFSNSERNQYSSKLEGMDKNWYYSGTKRFIRYSNIQPGVYHLWLKASNNDGKWSKPKKIISIHILAPFWQKEWFLFILIALLIGITLILARYYFTKKLKKRQLVLERRNEIEKIRNRISRDIHDDIGAGLTKIAMISQMAKFDINQNKNIDDKLNSLTLSARHLNERLQEIVWAMNPRYDDLNSLVAFLRSYASDYLENTNFEPVFDFPENIPTISLSPDLRRNLFLCFKEALNNTMKYSSATSLEISVGIENNNFNLFLKDNGIGFDKNEIRSCSNGLFNMQKRMEEINGSFLISSKKGNGTYIQISFPL